MMWLCGGDDFDNMLAVLTQYRVFQTVRQTEGQTEFLLANIARCIH